MLPNIHSLFSQGDRFIPYRGCEDDVLHEFLLYNDIYKVPNDKDIKKPDSTNEENKRPEGNSNTNDANFNSNSSNSSINSAGSNGAVARNSTHKKKQSFQELITESLFTNRRGSPNTVSL